MCQYNPVFKICNRLIASLSRLHRIQRIFSRVPSRSCGKSTPAWKYVCDKCEPGIYNVCAMIISPVFLGVLLLVRWRPPSGPQSTGSIPHSSLPGPWTLYVTTLDNLVIHHTSLTVTSSHKQHDHYHRTHELVYEPSVSAASLPLDITLVRTDITYSFCCCCYHQ